VRILGSALVGVLALLSAMPAHADPPGAKFRAGAAPGIVQPGTGSASRPPPELGGLHSAPGQMAHANRVSVPPPHWGPNRSDGSHRGWAAPYTVWGAPYVPYVWGGPYVPYRSYGDWGALWYPYAEWREPHGGWGNP